MKKEFVFDYEQTIKLKHNEIPAKINKTTGEVREIKKRRNNLPEGKTILKQENFAKINVKTIPYLIEECSKVELAIILQMVGKAEFNTNSLKPLSNETTVRELAEEFNISKNDVKRTFEHLYSLGVYASLKICKADSKEMWILNPYISFKGKLTDDALVANFKDTKIGIAYHS